MEHRTPGNCDFQLFINQHGRAVAKCRHCNQHYAHGVIVSYLNRFHRVRLQYEALVDAAKFMRGWLEANGHEDISDQAHEVYKSKHLRLSDHGSLKR